MRLWEPWFFFAVVAVAIVWVAGVAVSIHVGMLCGTASLVLVLPWFDSALSTAQVFGGVSGAAAVLAPASTFAVRSAWARKDWWRALFSGLIGAFCLFWTCHFSHQLFVLEQASASKAAHLNMKMRATLEADLKSAEAFLVRARAMPIAAGRHAQAIGDRNARGATIATAARNLDAARVQLSEVVAVDYVAPVAGIDWAFALLLCLVGAIGPISICCNHHAGTVRVGDAGELSCLTDGVSTMAHPIGTCVDRVVSQSRDAPRPARVPSAMGDVVTSTTSSENCGGCGRSRQLHHFIPAAMSPFWPHELSGRVRFQDARIQRLTFRRPSIHPLEATPCLTTRAPRLRLAQAIALGSSNTGADGLKTSCRGGHWSRGPPTGSMESLMECRSRSNNPV